jgi:hypothetical protein
MQQVVFDPWQIGTTEATLSWRVERSGAATQLAAVRYRIWRDRETPTWVTLPNAPLTGTATHDVTNFQGILRAEVSLTDALGQVETFLTEIVVSNRIAASAPDWMVLVNQTDTHVTLRWGQRYASDTTLNWLLYARTDVSDWQLLALLPVATTEVTAPWDAREGGLFEIRGADDQAREVSGAQLFLSAQSGTLLYFTPLSLTATELLTTLVLAEDVAFNALTWRVFDSVRTLAEGTAPGPVRAVIANYQGTLTLQAEMTDPLGQVHRVSQQVRVFNRVPRRPVLTLHSLGSHFIRVSIAADPADKATVAYVDIEALGLTVRKAAPTLHTYSGLQPDTEYSVRVRAVTPGGTAGPWSQHVLIRTLLDLSVPDPLPTALVPGPVLAQVLPWLQGALQPFFLQMVSDTRVRDPLGIQVVTPPDELRPFMVMVTPILPQLGEIMRAELNDQASYETSLLVDSLRDPISKLAALTERLTYGNVVNRGV